MNVLLIVIGLQALVFAGIIYVLKRLLERDLVQNALEHIANFHPSDSILKAEKVVIVSSGGLALETKESFTAAFRNRHLYANIDFLVNPSLLGGLVIELPGEVWDHSLVNRIKYLFRWS